MVSRKTTTLMKMAVLLSLLIVSAKLVIPLPFLDYISLQIVVVYLCYPLLGFRRSTFVLALYVVIGLLGFPVFASGGGPMYVFKPSFGFLIAYIGLPLIQQAINRYQKLTPLQRRFIGNYLGLIMIHLIGFSYKFIISKTFMHLTNSLVISSLFTSSLLDFSTDCLLVFVATILTNRLSRYFDCSVKNISKNIDFI